MYLEEINPLLIWLLLVSLSSKLCCFLKYGILNCGGTGTLIDHMSCTSEKYIHMQMLPIKTK